MSISSEGQLIADEQKLIEVRHQLHRLAERSGKEQKTSRYINRLLETKDADEIYRGIGGNGILGIFKGQSEGPVLMFRAELDALPIREEDDKAWASEDPATSHRCGHDGHMTTLIGIAQYLSENKPDKGEVWLLFQPAEETGQGAGWMLKDDFFQSRQPDLAFAYHNLPGYPKHQIIVNEGVFTATVRSVILSFEGSTSHAGQPERGKNPAYAIAKLIDASRAWNARSNRAYCNVVPIHVKVGHPAYGTAPGSGELHITFRSTEPELAMQLKGEIIEKAEELADQEGLELDISWLQPFDSCINSEQAVGMVRRAADQLSCDTVQRDEPFRWGEDFGKFTQAFDGALFCIGAGEDHPSLHSRNYDFPDELLETGIAMFRTIIDQNLNEE